MLAVPPSCELHCCCSRSCGGLIGPGCEQERLLGTSICAPHSVTDAPADGDCCCCCCAAAAAATAVARTIMHVACAPVTSTHTDRASTNAPQRCCSCRRRAPLNARPTGCMMPLRCAHTCGSAAPWKECNAMCTHRTCSLPTDVAETYTSTLNTTRPPPPPPPAHAPFLARALAALAASSSALCTR